MGQCEKPDRTQGSDRKSEVSDGAFCSSGRQWRSENERNIGLRTFQKSQFASRAVSGGFSENTALSTGGPVKRPNEICFIHQSPRKPCQIRKSLLLIRFPAGLPSTCIYSQTMQEFEINRRSLSKNPQEIFAHFFATVPETWSRSVQGGCEIEIMKNSKHTAVVPKNATESLSRITFFDNRHYFGAKLKNHLL